MDVSRKAMNKEVLEKGLGIYHRYGSFLPDNNSVT